MAMPFSRSMRSLSADSFQMVQVGMLIAIPFFLAWLVWFLAAGVTIMEISTNTKFEGNDVIFATYPDSARERLRIGQPARLRLNPIDSGVLSATALVTGISPGATGQTVLVELFATEPLPPVAPDTPLVKQVEVEVERVTPAVLVLRASGQFSKMPSISTSPQKTR